MRARMGWGSAISVAALAITLAFAGAQGATAVQGEAVIAGQTNTATNLTVVQNTSANADCAGAPASGLSACGYVGAQGRGTYLGVFGRGPKGVQGIGDTFGVEGLGNATGVHGEGITGVQGDGVENGVLAQGGTFGLFATGDDYGVYASGPNYGVSANSDSGTAVYASSPNGTALNVQGKLVSKRSGIVTLQASSGLSYATVTLSNMTASTFIVATIQGNVAGVWVRGVGISPPTNTFKIYLNKVPASDVRIGWFAMR